MHDDVLSDTPTLAAPEPAAGPADTRTLPAWLTSRWLLFGAIALAAFIVYANSIRNGFAYDDVWIVDKNTRVHQLRDLGSIWLTPYWPTFGKELGLYRPFTIFLFALEWAAGRGAPWFFHASNVALHAGV